MFPIRNRFLVEHTPQRGGRQGRLCVLDSGQRQSDSSIETPYLFPVVNVIGGPPGPERNGGIWRPIKWWMFLHDRREAFLCQVLHVLDFRITDARWRGWRDKPFHQWIQEWQAGREYTPNPTRHDAGYPFRSWMNHWAHWRQEPGSQPPVRPITFLDSGGFALMKATNFRKAKDWYGLDTTPEAIFGLQQELGGDLIASLDFPLPPGLSAREMRERQEQSIENGLALLRLMVEHPGVTSLPYVAVHGTTRESARWYVRTFFERWQQESPAVRQVPFGLAIGSMVPRADNPRTVVEVTWGVREALREVQPLLEAEGHTAPPLHMFGISSHLMGLLAYLGVDTFDSQTYADTAKRGSYLDADLRAIHIRDVTEETLKQCGCEFCQGIRELGILPTMQEVLVPLDRQERLSGGIERLYHPLRPGSAERATRSDFYGLLAMHNWRQISKEIERVRKAVASDRLADYLAELVRDHNGQRGYKLGDALAWMAEAEEAAGEPPVLKQAMERVLGRVLVPRKRPVPTPKPETVHVLRTPDDFRIPDGYRPPPGKKVLLIIACSKGKPYRSSAHQRQVLGRLAQEFSPEAVAQIHKVTLSGLYGPVPEEYEELPPILDYNFMLQAGDEAQAAIVGERLRSYLTKYGSDYDHILAYIYFAGYREVVEQVFQDLGISPEALVPARVLHRGGRVSWYLDELVERVAEGPKMQRRMQATLRLEDEGQYENPD